ncbi:MAG TPA: LutB/LldF family L-lactate oxidation iron-sulfur protein [Terriglobia bacterium]|nr:LutB/LldF family L-lactate oxidation iron-sulfur protein [Terriglobia bacterium]
MDLTPRHFKTYAKKNLKNSQLRKAYQFATAHALLKRKEQVRTIPEWEELRNKAHELKKEVIEHLGAYLEQLENRVTTNGGTVFWASDGREASDYILGLAQKFRVKTIVKSKSMTTEEMKLGPLLEKANIEVVETDLGEYIVQLAREMPSHITAPALHKTREEIGRLFAARLGIPYTSVPEELCTVARRILRQKFLVAEMGISGVNFAIAETGTIVVVENEGNARLSIGMPKIHVAVMGLEKVIPRLADLPVFLKLLPASSTGQRLTSYVSLVNSPRRPGELDGPEEFHLVILDNGRSEILANPMMRESLYCIRCGACLNTCPVYQRVGGHSYGSVYSGPIGAVLTPLYQGMEVAQDLPYASSLCGACSEICPVKINIHHLLLWLRSQVVKEDCSPWRERAMMKLFLMGMQDSFIYRMGSNLIRAAMRVSGKRDMALPVPGWTEARDFPPLAKKTFKQLWKDLEKEAQD